MLICQCYLASGEICKNKSKPNSLYCGIHKNCKRTNKSPSPKRKSPSPKRKKCPEGTILNTDSNRCVNIDGKIGKKILEKQKRENGQSPRKSPSPKRKECPEGTILNTDSNRCVNIDGKIGKKIVETQERNRQSYKQRSPSPKRKSPSPKRKSPSPKRKSPSPKSKSQGPIINWKSINYNNGVKMYISDISFETALEHLKNKDETFIKSLNSILSKYLSFFWECRPVNNLNKSLIPFEFVIIPTNLVEINMHLNKIPDTKTFLEKFKQNKCQENKVISFKNLSGESDLIVPCPSSAVTNYAHFSSFLRTASKKQILELWHVMSIKATEILYSLDYRNYENLYISTSGLGVSWLHVRLETNPKYYKFINYKNQYEI